MNRITSWSVKRMKNRKVKVSSKENEPDNDLVRKEDEESEVKVSSKEAAEMSDPY